MSAQQTPTTSRDPECAALAPLLALRETGALDDSEAARLDAHLATCAACQADAALDDALASRVRLALGAPAAVPLRMADIIAAVEAPPSDATLPAAPPARTPARVATPGWHPAPRWAGGFSAVAAAVAIIVLASYVFGGFGGRLGSNRRDVTPAPALSPLLAQQTVYVPTEVGIYALRASDGALRWAYPADIARTPMSDTRAIRDLALDGATLYALSAAPNDSAPRLSLLALDARTGAVRWSRDIPGLILGSLIQVGALLIVTPMNLASLGMPFGAKSSDWSILAFSAADGRRQWSRTLDEAPLCAPAAAGGALYECTDTRLIALDAATGVVRWTSPITPREGVDTSLLPTRNTYGALSAAGSYVFALTNFRVEPDNSLGASFYQIAAADGKHIGHTLILSEPSNGVFAPKPGGNLVFAPMLEGLCAFTIGSAYGIKWRFVPQGAPDGSVSVITGAKYSNGSATMTGAAYSNGVVYVTDLSGVLASHNGVTAWENDTYAVRASDGAELWRAPTNGGLTALTPVVSSGVVVAPTYATLVALRTTDGQQLWRYILPGGGGLESEPLVG